MKQALSKFFAWLGKANSEDNGNPSNTRFNVSYAILVLVPCIAFTLVYVVLEYKDIIIPTLSAVLAFLTALFGIKVWQKDKEQFEGGKENVQ